jgi:hypothetical protein
LANSTTLSLQRDELVDEPPGLANQKELKRRTHIIIKIYKKKR